MNPTSSPLASPPRGSTEPRRLAPLALAALLALAPLGSARAACRLVDGGPRFTLTAGEARDRLTGLVWRRCPLGMTWAESRCDGTPHFVSLDAAETAAQAEGPGWRLPDVKELYELLDDACGTPPIDTMVFPVIGDGDAERDGFWTTTPVGLGELWYFVDLVTATADGHSRGFQLAVLPVRKAP